jgi:putative phosphoesterase
MKIGIISDIHDEIDHLREVMLRIQADSCDRLICLGDVCSPSTLDLLSSLSGELPIDLVWGNCDDPFSLESAASHLPHVTTHGREAHLTLGGRSVAFTHLPHTAERWAFEGQHDLVLHGHTHEAFCRHIGSCILANPGEIQGRTGRISYALFDTELLELTIHPVLVRL